MLIFIMMLVVLIKYVSFQRKFQCSLFELFNHRYLISKYFFKYKSRSKEQTVNFNEFKCNKLFNFSNLLKIINNQNLCMKIIRYLKK